MQAEDLKRGPNYGSKHHKQRRRDVTEVVRTGDRTVRVRIEDFAPTWGMEIKYRLRDASGEAFEGRLHNTVHALPSR